MQEEKTPAEPAKKTTQHLNHGIDVQHSTQHLIVLNHGIDGTVKDMHAVRDALVKLQAPGLETWEASENEGKTHSGVEPCSERFWVALRSKIESVLGTQADKKLRVSFIGHSMGGLVLRSVATRLHASAELREQVVLDSMICIASPHLGCRLLGRGGKGGVAPLMTTFGPSLMRAGLRIIKGATGPDLLLDNGTLEGLADEAHIAALAAFERRVVYCNGSGDWLVNVESASLLTAEELACVLPASVAGCKGADAGVLAHRTWDDKGGWRAQRAATLLSRIRGAGAWELHLCHFFQRSSFAGGVFSPHIDLVDLPHKVTQHFGAEVVTHLAGTAAGNGMLDGKSGI